MKTEKVSVNLSPVELGQIDCLVDRGLFDSRSDFMRTAARKALDGYVEELNDFLKPKYLDTADADLWFTIGITGFTQREIDSMIASGKKLNIRVIGLLSLPGSVKPDEIIQFVKSCKVYGKIIASKEVKEALRQIGE